MTERLFDDLARTLAESMPRRRALRLGAGLLLGMLVPGLRARTALAASPPAKFSVSIAGVITHWWTFAGVKRSGDCVQDVRGSGSGRFTYASGSPKVVGLATFRGRQGFETLFYVPGQRQNSANVTYTTRSGTCESSAAVCPGQLRAVRGAELFVRWNGSQSTKPNVLETGHPIGAGSLECPYFGPWPLYDVKPGQLTKLTVPGLPLPPSGLPGSKGRCFTIRHVQPLVYSGKSSFALLEGTAKGEVRLVAVVCINRRLPCGGPTNPAYCGPKCCPKGTYCCYPSPGLCCKKDSACCPVGVEGMPPKWVCCPKECGPVAKPGDDGPRALGPRRYDCCPDERWVERFRFCCPPGELAIKRPAFGVDASGRVNCCPAAKLCGPAGPNQRCCRTDKLDPSIDQICCAGKCVSFRFNPEHCGGCNKRCAEGQICKSGVCAPP